MNYTSSSFPTNVFPMSSSPKMCLPVCLILIMWNKTRNKPQVVLSCCLHLGIAEIEILKQSKKKNYSQANTDTHLIIQKSCLKYNSTGPSQSARLVLENLGLIYKCFIKSPYLQNQQLLHDHPHTGEYCDWEKKKPNL